MRTAGKPPDHRRFDLRHLGLLLLAFVTAVVNTSCYDRVELEGMAFVVSMGIDKAPDDMIDVTARIAVPSQMNGKGGTGRAEAITVRARTVPSALNLLNASVERRISLLHLANLVIGEELAKDEKLIEYLRPMARFREFRRTVNLFVVRGNVREMYKVNKPVLEQSITRFIESLANVGKHTGLAPSQQFHEFMTAMESSNEDSIAPTIGINGKVKERRIEGEELSASPGEILRQGGNPLEFLGTAVFRESRLVTYLDGIETRMLLALRGDLVRTQMDFPDPLAEEHIISLELKHARAPDIEVDLDSRPVRVKVREHMEGDLIGIHSGIDYTHPDRIGKLETALSRRLEEQQQELITTLFHEHQTDPFHIMKRARRQFATADDLRKYPFRKVLKTAEVEVDVKVKIRRVGIQGAPFMAH